MIKSLCIKILVNVFDYFVKKLVSWNKKFVKKLHCVSVSEFEVLGFFMEWNLVFSK